MHSLTALIVSGQSAMVRQWEEKTLETPILGSRLFFSRSRGYPVCISSVVKYAPEEERLKRQRQQHGDELGHEVFVLPQRDWRGVSYAHLLTAALRDGKEPVNSACVGNYLVFVCSTLATLWLLCLVLCFVGGESISV